MRDFYSQYIADIFSALNYNIFELGGSKITPLSIIYLVVLSTILILLSGKLKNLLVTKLLGKTHLDIGAKQAIGTIARYLILLIGFLVVLQTVGIDLTTLNVVAGAVGIGVGFGLQNIANNFISGLIILTERPIKVGDRIEVEKINGRVTNIGARSTRVRTNDGITIIVPNSKFISESVVNWSSDGEMVRFRIPVGVSYDSDIDLVTKLLLEIADADEAVEPEPAPAVRLMEFGDNALNLELWVWSRDKVQRPGVLKSGINFAICRRFREHNIEIPFPQRNLLIQNKSSEDAIQVTKTQTSGK